jgi:hypothetical protein
MSFDPLSAIFDLGKSAIDKIWPDANKRAEELRKLEEMKQAGDIAKLNAYVQLMVGQLEINKIEAQGNMWQRGWRPLIGWAGGVAIVYHFIAYPLLMWGVPAESIPPQLDLTELMAITMTMLGARSFDKWKGTDSK